MSMTNDQAALIAAAISEKGYSSQATLQTAKTYAAALDEGLSRKDEISPTRKPFR